MHKNLQALIMVASFVIPGIVWVSNFNTSCAVMASEIKDLQEEKNLIRRKLEEISNKIDRIVGWHEKEGQNGRN